MLLVHSRRWRTWLGQVQTGLIRLDSLKKKGTIAVMPRFTKLPSRSIIDSPYSPTYLPSTSVVEVRLHGRFDTDDVDFPASRPCTGDTPPIASISIDYVGQPRFGLNYRFTPLCSYSR
jgi:hypothetical protein